MPLSSLSEVALQQMFPHFLLDSSPLPSSLLLPFQMRVERQFWRSAVITCFLSELLRFHRSDIGSPSPAEPVEMSPVLTDLNYSDLWQDDKNHQNMYSDCCHGYGTHSISSSLFNFLVAFNTWTLFCSSRITFSF